MTDIPRVGDPSTPALAGPDGKGGDGIRPAPSGPPLLDDAVPPAKGAVAGPDGRLRCPWGLSTPDYVAYHDEEWGRPVRGDQAIFERLCLEAFQSGLSWLTILRKRENFRKAFAGFDIPAVAAFTDADVARLLADAGIVRNRAKVNAAITNARAALAVTGGLSDLVWSYAGTEPGPAPQTLADLPAQTAASKALAKELRNRGFVFTGPVTVYAAMQACGLVNDHLEACFARNR
jgi:DNA-3-methyladenine glycosylase I